MPIYEYECKACGDVHEVMQKISEPPPAACPSCQGGPLAKLMSRTAFILKGDGWYVTDFRDKGKKAPEKQAEEGGKTKDGGKAADAPAAAGGSSSSSSSPSSAAPSSSGSTGSGGGTSGGSGSGGAPSAST